MRYFIVYYTIQRAHETRSKMPMVYKGYWYETLFSQCGVKQELYPNLLKIEEAILESWSDSDFCNVNITNIQEVNESDFDQYLSTEPMDKPTIL